MQTEIRNQLDPDTGLPVHHITIDDGDYDSMVLHRDSNDTDRFFLTIRTNDSEETHAFDRTDRQYRGMTPTDDTERRDIPDDVQDVLLELGFALEPEVMTDG